LKDDEENKFKEKEKKKKMRKVPTKRWKMGTQLGPS